jgi:kynurenine formamidase
VIYLSHFLNNTTPVYGGSEGVFKIEKTKAIANGDTSNNLQLSFPNHIGTHIDFPKHFKDDGATCGNYPASFWVFHKVGFLNCSIQDLPDRIIQLPGDLELLILKTGFGSKREEQAYWSAQPVIPAAFASILKGFFPNLRVFGFDLISLTSKLDRAEGKKAHLAFLIEQNILVLEDMNLEFLQNTPDTVIILPLLVQEADGVPCTVVALGS